MIHDHAGQAPVGSIVASDLVNAHDAEAKRLELIVDAPWPPVARVHKEDARLVDRYLCPGERPDEVCSNARMPRCLNARQPCCPKTQHARPALRARNAQRAQRAQVP